MIVDAHVHLFPDRLAEALRAWFDTHAWKPVYRQSADGLVAELAAGGVDRMVALPYAHKPGMARALNDFTRALAERHPQVVPCCTVFPGEEGEEAILDEALSTWAAGVKLHCHVTRTPADDPAFDAAWRASARHRKPVVVHAGRAPRLPGYGIDVHAVSGAERIRRVLERHPDATLIVPHLGADEIDGHLALLDAFPNLFLDTAMALSGHVGAKPELSFLARYAERILYGTDFPNIPYPWRTEGDLIRGLGLSAAQEAAIFGGNAARLFGISSR